MENPIWILTNSCDGTPRLGRRRIGGRHWLSKARPGALGRMDGNQNLCVGKDSDHAASAGPRAVGRGPQARLGFQRPVRGAGAPPGRAAQDPSDFLRVAYHSPKPGTVREGHLGQPARKGSLQRGDAQRGAGSGADTARRDATAQAVPEGAGTVAGLQERLSATAAANRVGAGVAPERDLPQGAVRLPGRSGARDCK